LVNCLKEGKEGVVELSSSKNLPVQLDDPELVRFMLQYLYGMEYVALPKETLSNDDSDNTVSNDESKFKLRPKMKYRKKVRKVSIMDVRLSSENSPSIDAGSSIDASPSQHGRGRAITHAQMCVMADFYGIQTLAKFARQQLILIMEDTWNTQEFVDVLDLACRPPLDDDNLIRTAVVDSISRHQSLLDKPEIEAILKQKPDILYNMLQGLRHLEPKMHGRTWDF
jgi:hypothetical protein